MSSARSLTKKKTGVPGYKFSSEEQLKIVSMIATYHKNEEIVKTIRDEWKKDISPTTLSYYKNSENWRPVITKIRDEYTAQISEIPLSNKRKRIEALSDLYEKALESEDLREARENVKAIRDELENKLPQSVHITQYNQLTNEDLEKRKLELTEKILRLRSTSKNSEIIEYKGESDG